VKQWTNQPANIAGLTPISCSLYCYLIFMVLVAFQQRHWPQHMSTCAQNTQQGGDGSTREGDMQRSSPQTSGGSNRKASPSQQHQVCPDTSGLKICLSVMIGWEGYVISNSPLALCTNRDKGTDLYSWCGNSRKISRWNCYASLGFP
jgi:hypothetical protein